LQRSIIAPAERVTNLRWTMALLIGLGILITGCDQVNIAANGAAITRDLNLSDIGFGWLLSGFGWAFAVAQIPFGPLLDRMGVVRVGRAWSLAWAIVSIVTSFVSVAFGALIGARIALGIAQAPALPTSAKAIGYWFPASERSGGTAIFDAAGKLGIAIGIPLMAYIGYISSWHTTYLVLGVAALVFFGVFFMFYRDPAEHKSLTYAEKQFLANGDAQSEGAPRVNVLAQPKVWALTIGYFAYAFAFFLLLMWLPNYIARTFHVGIFPTAIYAGIPWLIAAIADVLIGGLLVDTLIKRGANATLVRKSVLIVGMLLGLAVFGAVSAHDQNIALICIGIAIAGLGISAPVAWSMPSLIAPRGSVGTIASMMNCAGALGAIVAPISAGYIITMMPSFEDVFFAAGIVLVIGIACYTFLLGRIEPIADGEPAGILI
jgi:ACS family D-galactonate transporter-like MFS transporter